MKKLLATFVLCVTTAFGASPAFANKYIADINWSQLDCVVIPGYVMRLERLGDYLDDAAAEERENGNDGLATVLQTAANEAHLEADQGQLAYQSGDCKD